MLTPQQVGEQLNVSVQTVMRLTDSGQLPAVLIVNKPKSLMRRYRPEDVKAFIEARLTKKAA